MDLAATSQPEIVLPIAADIGLHAVRRLTFCYGCCWLVLMLGFAGCAKWKPDRAADSTPALPTPRMSPDSVTIDTVLVRFPVDSAARDLIWAGADESVVELEHRRLLDKNGIRVGVLRAELPAAIREQLHSTSAAQATEALEFAGLAADADNRMRQLSCRAGRRKELILRREINEPLTVVTTIDGRLSGESFERATALFDLRVVPHADGTATLRLVPEIQHGEMQQAFVGSEYGIRTEVRRHQAMWKDLAIEAKLESQGVLMVACTQPAKGLGRALLMTRTAVQTEEYVVLLVRLSRTQLDELFAPEVVEQARALTEQHR